MKQLIKKAFLAGQVNPMEDFSAWWEENEKNYNPNDDYEISMTAADLIEHAYTEGYRHGKGKPRSLPIEPHLLTYIVSWSLNRIGDFMRGHSHMIEQDPTLKKPELYTPEWSKYFNLTD